MNMAPPDHQIAAALGRVLPQARAAWLFGSAVSGSMRHDSDLDIAVKLDLPLPPDSRRAAVNELQQLLATDVDLLDFTRLHTVMQHQILTTGRLLFDWTPERTLSYSGFVASEYQNIQSWRQPLMQQLTARLVGA